MSRKKKSSSGRRPPKPKAHRPLTEAEQDEALVEDTAAVFSCSHEIAQDFLAQCRRDLDELDTGIVFGGLAEVLWRGRAADAPELVAVLRDYLELRKHHHAALEAVEKRLALLVDKHEHMHIDPIEDVRAVVREHLFPTDDQPA
jgi:hypothetical protein